MGEGPSDNHAIGWFDSSKIMPVRVNCFAAGPVRALVDVARHMIPQPGDNKCPLRSIAFHSDATPQCANAVLCCAMLPASSDRLDQSLLRVHCR